MSTKGVVYVTRIRESKDYGANDCFFALATKGNSKVGHGEFEYLCEVNKKGLHTKKVMNGKKDPTWEDCVAELEEATPPKGCPIIFTNRVYTFAEIALAAYEHNCFFSQDGLTRLNRWTNVPQTDKQIVEVAKAMSDEMNQARKAGNLAEGMNSFLIPQGSGDMATHDEGKIDHEEVVHNVSDEVNDNEEDMENMKERVALAESETDSIRRKNEILESQVAELKIQLESSLDNQRKFMVAGDKSTGAMDAMNEDVATKVANKLESKLDSLKTVTDNISQHLKFHPQMKVKLARLLMIF